MSGTPGPALRLVRPPPAAILIVVTHLLGVGHLARAAAIARALAAEGHTPTLVTGGRPAPIVDLAGLDVVQLPAVQCRGTDFRTLLDGTGEVALPALLAERRRILLETFAATRPELLILELFPFGRRQLAAEFNALLEAARASSPRPVVLVSVRDILNPPSKPSRVTDALAVLGRHVDRVLVHGDPAVSRLWDSWPCSSALAQRLVDTGYVADAGRPRPHAEGEPAADAEILVSGGGSAAALPLYRTALAAAALRPGRPWRILVGHGLPDEVFTALKAEAPSHVTVERARPDFPALLAKAAVSVSQCGYNTVVDLALAGVRGVVVPFEEGNEQEQRLRAGRLAAEGLVQSVPQAELSPERLIEAIDGSLAGPAPGRRRLDVGGLAATSRACAEAIARGRTRTDAKSRLVRHLDAFGTGGRTLDMWWRDDDAVADTPALRRLLELSLRLRAPVALAVIPSRVEESLAAALEDSPDVAVLQHGFAHADHAAEGQKKTELVGGPLADLVRLELDTGRRRLARLFGRRFLPVLVPPWNRIDADLVAALPGLGFRALSTFRPRRSREASPGLEQVNTHWDPIAWRAGGGLRDTGDLWGELADHAEQVLAGAIDGGEPLGLLTHHLVHDAWIWSFLEEVLALLAAHPSVRIHTPWSIFPA